MTKNITKSNKRTFNIADKFRFPKCLSFYLQLLKKMQLGQELPYRYIYSCGGKNSGKTYCICLFIAYLFYYQISASIIIFRKQANSLTDDEKGTIAEVKNRLDDLHIKYKLNKSSKIITSPNTRVIFLSLFNPQGQKIQQLGLAGNSRYTYEIPWFEEVWEMEENSVRDAELAVRGAKHTLTLYTTNPYGMSQWFVAYYVKRFKPQRNILLREGYQWKFFPEDKSIFHYTNYRVNPGISQAHINNIEILREKDPATYDVVGIGLPGVPYGGVYAHLLKHSSKLLQPTNTYSLGLDWGFKHDPLAVILIRTQILNPLRT